MKEQFISFHSVRGHVRLQKTETQGLSSLFQQVTFQVPDTIFKVVKVFPCRRTFDNIKVEAKTSIVETRDRHIDI